MFDLGYLVLLLWVCCSEWLLAVACCDLLTCLWVYRVWVVVVFGSNVLFSIRLG